MAKITVTAGEGRTFPVHHTIATAPGGALQLLRPGDEFEVDDSHTTIQRALQSHDLVRVASPRPRSPGGAVQPGAGHPDRRRADGGVRRDPRGVSATPLWITSKIASLTSRCCSPTCVARGSSNRPASSFLFTGPATAGVFKIAGRVVTVPINVGDAAPLRG